RLLFAGVLIALTSSSALFLARLAPGDMTSQLGPFASPVDIENTRTRFNLDRSPISQWGLWVSRAMRLDFGESFLYNRPVAPLVVRAAGNTALLGVVSLLLATLAGLSLGVFTGARSGTLPMLVRSVSLVCVSLPPLVTSLALVFLAARTGWLPAGGMVSSTASDQTWSVWMLDVLRHLPLPVLALALPMAATFERLQSQSMADAVHQPFVLAAIARGVPATRALLRHAWPSSLRPICGVYGLAIGALLSGSFIVEFVTAWPGLGRLTFEALRARDVYLVAACAASGAAFLALGTMTGDLLLAAADPRVRQESVG
ncbi:MAG TPA: ABC transporter permease, partial [Vicinamibacterales bacterium]|nr:ABC transporter permease [Vicinamibacterales bacterium]